MHSKTSRMITKIEVSNLFGKYNYSLPSSGYLTNPSILYGDNGVGKSTILKIAFDLLSSANDKGHRTALAKIDFKIIRIFLNNSYMVEASRSENGRGDLLRLRTYEVTKDENGKEDLMPITEWIHGTEKINHFPDGFDIEYKMFEDGVSFNDKVRILNLIRETQKNKKKSDQSNIRRGNDRFLEHLEQICPNIYYLNADRKLVGDSVQSDGEDYRLLSRIRSSDIKGVVKAVEEIKKNSLSSALISASRWFQVRAVRDANRGSEDVHQAYGSIIQRIAKAYGPEDSAGAQEISKLTEEIDKIRKTTREYSEFELTAALDMSEFTKALSDLSGPADITYRLLSPYVESLKARLDATKGIYAEIKNFVDTVNSFLVGKIIKFTLSQGLHLKDEQGASLDAEHLSSGEQQLLLMFCHVLVARDEESVFIIDEPEISLNIKWQRILLSSLSRIAGTSKVQFIFASHSFEIIAQHRQCVVKVEQANG